MQPRPVPKAEQKRHAAMADQYFTRPTVAERCVNWMAEVLGLAMADQMLWVEPSAGNGAFVDILMSRQLNVWAGDLHPQHHKVVRHDYLNDPLPGAKHGQPIVVIGNPPFGKKSRLAGSFINRGLHHGGLVGMILPVQLRKWSAQRHINNQARLILDRDLDEDSFLFLGEPYDLRCCFQVWSTWKTHQDHENLRLTQPPSKKHPDFEAWQYNCTPQAKRYFDYDWDFAVLRQGYGDFSLLHRPDEKSGMNERKQWIFIKAKDKQALQILENLNFTELSRHNTGVPGFGKADLVEAYIRAKKNNEPLGEPLTIE